MKLRNLIYATTAATILGDANYIYADGKDPSAGKSTDEQIEDLRKRLDDCCEKKKTSPKPKGPSGPSTRDLAIEATARATSVLGGEVDKLDGRLDRYEARLDSLRYEMGETRGIAGDGIELMDKIEDRVTGIETREKIAEDRLTLLEKLTGDNTRTYLTGLTGYGDGHFELGVGAGLESKNAKFGLGLNWHLPQEEVTYETTRLGENDFGYSQLDEKTIRKSAEKDVYAALAVGGFRPVPLFLGFHVGARRAHLEQDRTTTVTHFDWDGEVRESDTDPKQYSEDGLTRFMWGIGLEVPISDHLKVQTYLDRSRGNHYLTAGVSYNLGGSE